MADFTDHSSLIATLGGGAVVAQGISALDVNVRAWNARNRIPTEYWPALIEFAAREGVEVTADWLMVTTPARRRLAREAA